MRKQLVSARLRSQCGTQALPGANIPIAWRCDVMPWRNAFIDYHAKPKSNQCVFVDSYGLNAKTHIKPMCFRWFLSKIKPQLFRWFLWVNKKTTIKPVLLTMLMMMLQFPSTSMKRNARMLTFPTSMNRTAGEPVQALPDYIPDNTSDHFRLLVQALPSHACLGSWSVLC